MEELKVRIPRLHSAQKIEEIRKGYSFDKKYLVVVNKHEKYLLRTSNVQEYARKTTEFAILKEMKQLNVRSPEAVEIGVLEDLEICYSIYSYVEGEDAKSLLPAYAPNEQYSIGVAASHDLKHMHSLNAPPYIGSWFHRITKKHKRYIDAYKSCGKRIQYDEKLMDFIETNIDYLKNRPSRFQHDDFHLGNIIVKEKQYSGVIDFDRFDWGDPIHDFVKLGMFSCEISIPFSIGQVTGYFNGEIPPHFWRVYSIYLAMTIFSSIVWTLKVVPGTINEMMERLYRVMEEHKNFESFQPNWFSTPS